MPGHAGLNGSGKWPDQSDQVKSKQMNSKPTNSTKPKEESAQPFQFQPVSHIQPQSMPLLTLLTLVPAFTQVNTLNITISITSSVRDALSTIGKNATKRPTWPGWCAPLVSILSMAAYCSAASSITVTITTMMSLLIYCGPKRHVVGCCILNAALGTACPQFSIRGSFKSTR